MISLFQKPKSPPPPVANMPKFDPRPIYQTEDFFSHVSSTSEGSLRTSGTFSSSQNNTQFKIAQRATTGNANHDEHLVNAIDDNNQAIRTVSDSASSIACSADVISEENPKLVNNFNGSSVSDVPSVGGQADFNATQEYPKSEADEESLTL